MNTSDRQNYYTAQINYLRSEYGMTTVQASQAIKEQENAVERERAARECQARNSDSRAAW